MRLRNSIPDIGDGNADDADAVVQITSSQLAGPVDVSTVTATAGDAEAFGRLVSFLDRDMAGSSMHQRWTRLRVDASSVGVSSPKVRLPAERLASPGEVAAVAGAL